MNEWMREKGVLTVSILPVKGMNEGLLPKPMYLNFI